MNCRGDDGIDAKRSRPSIGKTRYLCHARLERVLLVGTRSADYIRASGHSGRIQRPYTWLHPTPFAEMPDFSLAPRAPSIHGGDLNRSTQHFILKGKDGVSGDKSKISSRFYCGRE